MNNQKYILVIKDRSGYSMKST